ncbi:hypothetical protein [uncultured Campylobacter sp.]|uniref:hypothetical protein n=1 Tax=uncultured Campylobacter sp. TaxID=218934 RepID=UPI00261A7D31|nr:hypothetical protein [uncultured Campylobacter sp.]
MQLNGGRCFDYRHAGFKFSSVTNASCLAHCEGYVRRAETISLAPPRCFMSIAAMETLIWYRRYDA